MFRSIEETSRFWPNCALKKHASSLAKGNCRAPTICGLRGGMRAQSLHRQKTKRSEFPAKAEYIRKLYTHELDKLLSLAGLDAQLNKDMGANKVFEANWSTVKDWTEESRYRTSD